MQTDQSCSCLCDHKHKGQFCEIGEYSFFCLFVAHAICKNDNFQSAEEIRCVFDDI